MTNSSETDSPAGLKVEDMIQSGEGELSTVEGMNAGVPLRELMAAIKTPPELTLTEEYGRVPWNVRAIWHEYTGWFDPSRGTTELYEVPPGAVAPTLAELSGGNNLWERMWINAELQDLDG